jgi:hypothetical protein
MIYLIEYDRQLGKLVNLEKFNSADRTMAEGQRLALELELLSRNVNREVVLLEALSEDDLRKTHRRYFEDLEEGLEELAGIQVV